jgi:mRNA interferase RelE/StbE
VYRIEIEAEAERDLRRLPRKTAKRIRSKLLALAEDPFARNANVRKLSGRDTWRLRIGDWRALYTVDTGQPDHLDHGHQVACERL